ncbi:hypothetical protein J2Y38_002163 [Flavobacterium sp. 2755]|uniref:DUF6625 family protein n=1 Tax=Flavobacterium sp. 2755 TaxID=2817765 RepID=UPI0028672A19|nr:DUF6625 family protein [Flavobacterium sp. 2755]MDR6761952.1 hypothetical protein [Flavobacterium sp. 2755]
MKKIALVNCYIGKFPWFFNFFLKSCEFNPTVDFFILTDNVLDYEVPHNVKIIPFTLDDFNTLATAKLGFEVNLNKPYKLCDFKPAYGFLFSEYLEDYDFWGITDIDVVYGRIREFMTEEVLEEFDIVCVRHDFITACCMLFRNTDYINTLFKKSRDYEMIFTTPKNYAFDETNFEQSAIKEKEDIFNIQCEIETMQHIILQEENQGKLKAHFDFLICEGTAGRLKWENGMFCYHDKLEILLYHLLNYKGNIFSNNVMKWDLIPDVFYIDKHDYRKNNALFSLLNLLYYDRIKPSFWRLAKRIDAFFTINVFKNKLTCIDEGEYLYYLSKVKIIIKKGDEGENYLKLGDLDEVLLYRMTFNKNYFFAEKLSFIFRLENASNDTYKRFSLISDEGYGNTYNKLEN